MELKEHIDILKKRRTFIVSFVLILTLVGAAVGYMNPVRYKSSVAFTIRRISEQSTQDYKYDDYYALRSAELVGQTVLSWFLTPSFLVDVYKLAEVNPNITSLERFPRRFKAKLYSPQNLVVTFSDDSEEVAQKLSKAMVKKVEEEVHSLDQTKGSENVFEVVGGTPVVVAYKLSTATTAVAGFFIGVVLSIMLVYIARYFGTEPKV